MYNAFTLFTGVKILNYKRFVVFRYVRGERRAPKTNTKFDQKIDFKPATL